MPVRADWSLELQLEQCRKESEADEVKNAISDAIAHMHSGRSRNRRSGQAFVRLLEIARLRASEESEWQVVRLLQDSIDYTTGRILKPDFEERYRLFQDGALDETNRKYVSWTLRISAEWAVEEGRTFLRDHPTATTEELIEYLDSLGKDAQHLEAPENRPGRYRIVRGRAESRLWLQRAMRDRVDVEDPSEVADRLIKLPEALAALTDVRDAQTILRAAELKQRAASLVRLRGLIEDETVLEKDLQSALVGQSWIFGGRFVGTAARRRLVPGDEVDIPLLRADGSLHIVELKRAMGVHPLVKRHRNSLVPSDQVHVAVGQALNYLVGLDENRATIRDEFGIEARRASVLVLIGHPSVHPDLDESAINEVLRTVNTNMARVEVMTYKELLDSAERVLRL